MIDLNPFPIDPTIGMLYYTQDLKEYVNTSPILILLFNEIWHTSGVHIIADKNCNGFEVTFRDHAAFENFFLFASQSIPSTDNKPSGFKWQISFTVIPEDLNETDLLKFLSKAYEKMKIPVHSIEGTGVFEAFYPNEEAYAASFLELIQNHPNADLIRMEE
jgi:hypothetical protein